MIQATECCSHEGRRVNIVCYTVVFYRNSKYLQLVVNTSLAAVDEEHIFIVVRMT